VMHQEALLGCRIITTSGKVTAKGPYSTEDKQGCPLSPVLFLFIIQAVCKPLDHKWTFQRPPLQTSSCKQTSSRFLLQRREMRKRCLSDTDRTLTRCGSKLSFTLIPKNQRSIEKVSKR
jgi:hypothetical protein